MSSHWDRRDLFPLPSRSARRRQREAKRRTIDLALAEMESGLTWLCSDDHAERERSGIRHALTRQYLLERRRYACRRGLLGEPVATVETGVSAPGHLIPDAAGTEFLNPPKISLLEDQVAGTVKLLDVIPVALRPLYRQVGQVTQTTSSEELRGTKRVVLVKDQEYSRLIRVLTEKGIVELTCVRPEEINGVSGVPKDYNKQRLIVDARRANLQFLPPPGVEMPHPGLFTELELRPRETVLTMKLDIDNFYHRLELPMHLRTYFGMPSVEVKRRRMWPRLRVLPMGWSQSVVLAQSIHDAVLGGVGLERDNKILYGGSRKITGLSYGAYIDDFFGLGTDEKAMSTTFRRVKAGFTAIGLPVKPSKSHPPTRQSTTILGIEFTSDGQLEPERGKFGILIQRSRMMLKKETWSLHEAETVLGSWNWFALLRRPIFSLMVEIYVGVQRARSIKADYIKITSGMRSELRCLVALSPLIHHDLRKQWDDNMIATDASMEGGGGVYRETKLWTPRLVNIVGKPFKALDAPSEGLPQDAWKVAIRHRWKHKSHFNVLEGQALLLMLRWLIRRNRSYKRETIAQIDSQVLYYALWKSRSSARYLMILTRRYAAIELSLNLTVVPVWIPSELNPADAPSRHL